MKFFDCEKRKCSEAVNGRFASIFKRRKLTLKICEIFARGELTFFKIFLTILSSLFEEVCRFLICSRRPGFESPSLIKPRVLLWSNRPYKKPGRPESKPCAQS